MRRDRTILHQQLRLHLSLLQPHFERQLLRLPSKRYLQLPYSSQYLILLEYNLVHFNQPTLELQRRLESDFEVRELKLLVPVGRLELEILPLQPHRERKLLAPHEMLQASVGKSLKHRFYVHLLLQAVARQTYMIVRREAQVELRIPQQLLCLVQQSQELFLVAVLQPDHVPVVVIQLVPHLRLA